MRGGPATSWLPSETPRQSGTKVRLRAVSSPHPAQQGRRRGPGNAAAGFLRVASSPPSRPAGKALPSREGVKALPLPVSS